VDDSLSEREAKQGSRFIPEEVRERRAGERLAAGDEAPDLLTNAEPLLVNKTDTWSKRPETRTAFPNLFLAGDYVRTHTNLATMEAANESGRRAANAILSADGAPASCEVFELHEPFAALARRDEPRWRAGQAWASPLRGIPFYVAAWLGAVSLRAVFLLALLSRGTVIFGAIAAALALSVHLHFPAVWQALFRGGCRVMELGSGLHAPASCRGGVPPPDAASVSVFWFGLYAIGFGVSLSTLPRTVLGRLGFPRERGPWMAVLGGGPAVIGVFYLVAALYRLEAFFWILVAGRVAIFLLCMRLRCGRHDASGLLLLAAVPDLLGACWTTLALSESQVQGLGIILGIGNVIAAAAFYLFPTETRWRLGFAREAGNWLPLAAALLAFWGLYEIAAAAAAWLPLVWTTVVGRAAFGTLCVISALRYGAARDAVESPWRLQLAGFGFWGTALLLARALLHGL
jgi:hypothetical protein